MSILNSSIVPARLLIAGEYAALTGVAVGDEPQRLAPGLEDLVREHFSPRVSRALAMENAIATIEDELARVPASVHGVDVASDDPNVRAVADAAGLHASATELHRDAVEQVFARLSAVALGRPAASEGLPDDPRFAAALLVVRELMHHLGIPLIHLDVRPSARDR